MGLFSKKPKAASGLIGIDIGTGAVMMAQLEGSGAHVLVDRLPDNIIRDGEIVAPESLSSFIKSMKTRGGFVGTRCALLLPGKITFFRTLQMPAVSENQLLLNLPYEFRDYVGQDAGDYNYDYAVKSVERDADGTPVAYELYAAAAQMSEMKKIAEILAGAGLELAVAQPREMALLKLLQNSKVVTAAQEEFCLVDIDYDCTRVNIIRGTQLAAGRTIDVGCRQIDAAIAKHYEIDEYVAATYRLKNYQNVLSSEACAEVFSKIALEITKATNFYQYENPESTVTAVRFCGPGYTDDAIAQAIVDYIGLAQRPTADLLPSVCADNSDAAACALVIGAAQ